MPFLAVCSSFPMWHLRFMMSFRCTAMMGIREIRRDYSFGGFIQGCYSSK